MKDDLREDVPGSRMSIEAVATRFNVTFLFVMSMIASGLFLFGLSMTGAKQLDAVPESVLLIGIGMGGFSLFFPWYTAILFARHLLHSVRSLEARLEQLEKDRKPRKVDEPWREEDDLV